MDWLAETSIAVVAIADRNRELPPMGDRTLSLNDAHHSLSLGSLAAGTALAV